MTTQNAGYFQRTSRIRKTARIWSLVIIALGMVIIIAEIVEAFLNPELINSYPWYENLIPMTLFLAVVGLALAWRWEIFGSVLSIICVVSNYVMYIVFGGSGRGLLVVPLILLPVLIPGILFLISSLRTERGSKQSYA